MRVNLADPDNGSFACGAMTSMVVRYGGGEAGRSAKPHSVEHIRKA